MKAEANHSKGENMNTFVNRMLRAARLDVSLYEEVEADSSAMPQALLTVILASVAAGIGSSAQVGVAGLVTGTLTALAGWFIWAFLTYFIGTRILPEAQTRATYGELLRTIGFASSPGLIRILAIIPGLAVVVFPVAAVWMLIAMVIAVRQALDYTSTWRAIGVCIIGWVIQVAVLSVVYLLLGVPGDVPG
jgi:hypothetical protein